MSPGPRASRLRRSAGERGLAAEARACLQRAVPTLLGERRRPRSALAQPRRAARRPLFLRPVRPLGDRVHSQFLEASVQLHVHGVERVQAAPVLYVSAGGREHRARVSCGARKALDPPRRRTPPTSASPAAR